MAVAQCSSQCSSQRGLVSQVELETYPIFFFGHGVTYSLGVRHVESLL